MYAIRSYYALGFRSSLVVLIAIPVSVLAGIGLIDLSGFGLQQMSIAGLIIALGMLVDNSIAIAENIYRYMAKGYKPMEAAVQGSSEIAMALMADEDRHPHAGGMHPDLRRNNFV